MYVLSDESKENKIYKLYISDLEYDKLFEKGKKEYKKYKGAQLEHFLTTPYDFTRVR